jgi:DNA-binding NarL/FixJ family response regulator
MQKYSVLLADDHAIVRAGIRNAIENLPQIIVRGEASNGPTLMAALKELHPDILLIDVTMPEFEPISAIREIRVKYPDMKILVISAYDDDVYVQGLLTAGVNGYHLKDQPLQDLNLAIERIINGERWISSSLVEKLITRSDTMAVTPTLSLRQREILGLLKKGWNNQKIAYQLNLSVKTVENHLTRIYRTLNVQSRLEAVNYINNNPQILNNTDDQPFPEAGSGSHAKNISVHPLQILLVDDNPRFRFHLKRTIKNINNAIRVLEADTLDKAFLTATSANLSLILMDVILGDENGILGVKKIKKLTQNTKVILISAYPDQEFHRQGIEAGATAFLDKKTLDSATLKHIIEDLV